MSRDYTTPSASPIVPCAALALVASVSAILLGGCTSHKVTAADSGNKDRVHESDFYHPPTASSSPSNHPVVQSSDTSTPSTDPDPFTLSTPTHQSAPPTIAPPVAGSATDPAAGSVAGSSSLELLDAKIGDINGHPIYASEFFAPIRDQLIAEAKRLDMPKWQQTAGRIIAIRLDGIITDELLRAEALASLSQQQRLGLRAFLQGFRTDLLSQNLGSQELANKRILEEQGVTLDEALRQHEVDQLIRLTLYREINRRINVSWRDIKQRYERDLEKYAPPPTANFRRIRVFTSSADDVAAVTEQLNNGTPFHHIAASELNTFKPEIGGEESFHIDGSLAETKFYGIDILNEKAQSLSVGEWTGPFEAGASTYWLKLEGIEQHSISLYDAQLAIQREITVERRQEEQRAYLERLIDRAHFSSRDEILMQLFEIAEQRYGPAQ